LREFLSFEASSVLLLTDKDNISVAIVSVKYILSLAIYFSGVYKKRMELLNTKQAAERLGVSVIRIRQLIKGGKIEAQNLGRDYAIVSDSLAGVVTYGKAGRPPKAKPEAEDAAPADATGPAEAVAEPKATKPKRTRKAKAATAAKAGKPTRAKKAK
jgi:excisionase family DNA binding protein